MEVIVKQRNIGIVWLFLGIFMAVSVSGLAQWRRAGTWAYGDLNLSDEQLARIQEVRLTFQERIMPLRLQWQKAQLDLDTLTMKGAGQKELEAPYKVLDRVEIELDKAYQAHWNEVRNLLNEEQGILFDRYGGLGMGLGRGRGFGPGYGLGMRQGYRPGWGPGMGLRFGGGWGRGLGRGYFCPWFRWR